MCWQILAGVILAGTSAKIVNSKCLAILVWEYLEWQTSI
jgi:hypothetical protein